MSNANNTGSIINSGSGGGGVTISAVGAGVMGITQSSSTSLLTVSGANTAYAGSVNVALGTLAMGGSKALNSANTVSVASGGTFDLNNNSETIAGLNDGASVGGTVTNSGTAVKTLTLGGNGTYSYGGLLTATTAANLALTVNLTGGGSQTLYGASNYAGATNVNGGVLNLTGTLSGTNITVGGATANLSEGTGCDCRRRKHFHSQQRVGDAGRRQHL